MPSYSFHRIALNLWQDRDKTWSIRLGRLKLLRSAIAVLSL